jgi:hypothetical protein
MPASIATAGARAMPSRRRRSGARGYHPRCAPRERRGDGVGAGLGGVEVRHAGTAQCGQRLRRFRRDERHQRLARARALDDRPHGLFRLRPRRRANDGEHEIEFRCRQQNVQRGFHGVVLRAGDGEVDEPRRLDFDPGGGELCQGRGAGLLDGDTAARQRIDHHGRAARRRCHDPYIAPPAACRDRHAREQWQTLDQRVERIDPGDAAFGEKDVGDVVLPRERAGMRDRELARRGGAAELVGQHRLAAFRGCQREAAQRIGMPHRLEEQHVAVDAGIIERRRADVAERQVDLVADRDQAGEADAARLAARQQCADQAAGVGGGEDTPGRQVELVEGGVGRHHRFGAQVDDAEARWPDQADTGVGAGLAQARFARDACGASFGEAVGQHGRDLDAEPAAVFDRRDGGLGLGHDIDVVGRLGQRGERRPGALAEHALAPRIDRIDAAGIAHLPQELQRPAGGLAGVVRLADDGDRSRREQRVAQVHSAASAGLGWR